VQQLRH